MGSFIQYVHKIYRIICARTKADLSLSFIIIIIDCFSLYLIRFTSLIVLKIKNYMKKHKFFSFVCVLFVIQDFINICKIQRFFILIMILFNVVFISSIFFVSFLFVKSIENHIEYKRKSGSTTSEICLSFDFTDIANLKKFADSFFLVFLVVVKLYRNSQSLIK